MQILVENQKTIGYYPLDLRDKIRLMGDYDPIVKCAESPINNLRIT